MKRMLPAEFAILLEFKLIGRLLLVFVGTVVLPLAIGTIETHRNTHNLLQINYLLSQTGGDGMFFHPRPRSAC